MKKERKVNMILAIVLWLICIAMFLPMVFVIINSFKTFGQVVMEPLALPEEWNLDNFKEVMKTGNYLKVFGNTIYFAVVSGVIVIALGAMAGYKLDRMNNRIGEITSIVFMIAITALKRVFTKDEIKELPVRYSFMLVLIPIGSIYIMNNIFMLGYKLHSNRANIQSAVTAVILLGVNVLVFYIYIKYYFI